MTSTAGKLLVLPAFKPVAHGFKRPQLRPQYYCGDGPFTTALQQQLQPRQLFFREFSTIAVTATQPQAI